MASRLGSRLKDASWQLLLSLVMIIGVLVVVLPIVWMVFASIRPTTETLAHPPKWIPKQITLKNYQALLSNPRYWSFLKNGYIISTLTAGLCVVVGSLAAYGFSRFRMRGERFIMLGILALQMLPGVALIIPFFNMVRALHIHNTHMALVLADTSFVLPITIWLMRAYLDSIPIEFEEAAMVDGCNRVQALYRILLPLALPGLIAVATMGFLSAWNEFMFAVVLTSGPEVAPLTIGIAEFFTKFGRDWGRIMALNSVGSLPLMFVFVFLQRWVVQGMTAGAIK
jgi:multiple sugar transport system permease protein